MNTQIHAGIAREQGPQNSCCRIKFIPENQCRVHDDTGSIGRMARKEAEHSTPITVHDRYHRRKIGIASRTVTFKKGLQTDDENWSHKRVTNPATKTNHTPSRHPPQRKATYIIERMSGIHTNFPV